MDKVNRAPMHRRRSSASFAPQIMQDPGSVPVERLAATVVLYNPDDKIESGSWSIKGVSTIHDTVLGTDWILDNLYDQSVPGQQMWEELFAPHLIDCFDPINAVSDTEPNVSPTIRHIRLSGPEFSGKTWLFESLLGMIGSHLFSLKTGSHQRFQVVINITEACSTDSRGRISHCRDLGPMLFKDAPRTFTTKEDSTRNSLEYDESKVTRLLVITKRGWDVIIKKVFGEPFKGGGVRNRAGVATATHVSVHIDLIWDEYTTKSKDISSLGLNDLRHGVKKTTLIVTDPCGTGPAARSVRAFGNQSQFILQSYFESIDSDIQSGAKRDQDLAVYMRRLAKADPLADVHRVRLVHNTLVKGGVIMNVICLNTNKAEMSRAREYLVKGPGISSVDTSILSPGSHLKTNVIDYSSGPPNNSKVRASSSLGNRKESTLTGSVTGPTRLRAASIGPKMPNKRSPTPSLGSDSLHESSTLHIHSRFQRDSVANDTSDVSHARFTITQEELDVANTRISVLEHHQRAMQDLNDRLETAEMGHDQQTRELEQQVQSQVQIINHQEHDLDTQRRVISSLKDKNAKLQKVVATMMEGVNDGVAGDSEKSFNQGSKAEC